MHSRGGRSEEENTWVVTWGLSLLYEFSDLFILLLDVAER